MRFYSHANLTDFNMKGRAPRLALRKRLMVIRKWPIVNLSFPCYLFVFLQQRSETESPFVRRIIRSKQTLLRACLSALEGLEYTDMIT